MVKRFLLKLIGNFWKDHKLKRIQSSISKRKKKFANFISKYLPGGLANKIKMKADSLLNEKVFPGRMYSFIAIKK